MIIKSEHIFDSFAVALEDYDGYDEVFERENAYGSVVYG